MCATKAQNRTQANLKHLRLYVYSVTQGHKDNALQSVSVLSDMFSPRYSVFKNFAVLEKLFIKNNRKNIHLVQK